jgi:hypothetical protein
MEEIDMKNYSRLRNKGYSIFTLIISVVCLPHSVFASNFYLETEHTQFFVGDTVLVDVKIDSEGKKINAAEGRISIQYPQDALRIKDINVSGSSFSLWPDKPSFLSEEATTISFAGGIPSGLKQQGATVFKFALNFKDVGDITLTPEDISVYLHDGSGTKDTTNTRSLILHVVPREFGDRSTDDLDVAIAKDTTPPLPFEIFVGQDNSVFDGKTFLSFSTVDEQSGIKYYEVSEGILPPIRSDGIYVLQNQDAKTKVLVVAYDAAGNARESVYEHAYPYRNNVLIVGLALLLLLILIYVRKKKKR